MDMGITEQLELAIKVVLSWQSLVTAALFIALWSLLRVIADPYSAKDHKLPKLRLPVAKPKPAPPPSRGKPGDGEDDEDEPPDEAE